MPHLLSLAAASINTHAGAISQHKKTIINASKNAAEQGADILLFPELALTGYGCEDLFFSEDFLQSMPQHLIDIAKALPHELLVCLGFPLWFEGQCYNAVALLREGRCVGVVCKQYLAMSGIHYEKRWFKPWPDGLQAQITVGDHEVVVGDWVFDISGLRLGFEICEDAWVEQRPGHALAKRGVDIILNPSASHFALTKHEKRQRIVKQGSQQFDAVYLYCNLLGCEAGRAIYDGGNILAQQGELLHLGQRFSFSDYQLETYQVSIELKHLPHQKGVHALSFGCGKSITKCLPTTPLNIEKENEADVLIDAIALGLWDWQRKTLTQGFTLSLSGGADSGLCATAVFAAHLKALYSLGSDAYCSVLASCGIAAKRPEKSQDQTEWLKQTVIPKVLTTVYQSSDNSSTMTCDAAKALADSLGAEHHQWSISDLVKEYMSLANNAQIQAPLNWQDDDIALQNIQARVRSPGIWLIANMKNQLLIATSNLSEASVGYCTMDGDTSGVLSPIGGLAKTKVLMLNEYLFKHGFKLSTEAKQCVRIHGLANIVTQTPTAELRPVMQNDETDLMPYSVLDTIRQLTQVDFLSPKQVFERLKQQEDMAVYGEDKLALWLSRYYQLYKRNQWKRERLAASFHLEIDSACPKTYRRYPVLSAYP